MKKLLWMLAVCLLLTACAPANPTEPGTEPAPAETTQMTQPQDPTIGETIPETEPEEELVTCLMDEQVVWDDEFDNHYNVIVRVPQVNAPWASEFNEQIRADGEAILAETRSCAEEGYSPAACGFDYQVSIYENYLSILVTESFDSDYTEYSAYVFDVEAGEVCNPAQLCRDLLGVSYPQFLMATNSMIKEEFEAIFGEYGAVNEPEFYAEILESIENDTIAMSRRALFPDEEGKLILLYWKPSMAGASYYPTVTALDESCLSFPGEEEGYRWLFDLCDRGEDIYTESARELLYRTWEADPDRFDREIEKCPAEQRRRILAMPETDQ